MSNDHYIEFEENNFEELVEKFIVKYKEEWEDFVMSEYTNSVEEPVFEYDTLEEKKLDRG